MLGWLVVNSFINTKKFEEIYAFLKNAGDKFNVQLEIKKSSELLCEINDDFKSLGLPNFVLFWDKDIYLAKRLEEMKIPLFNSSYSIETCDNKILTALALKGEVDMPKTIIAPKTFENVNYNDKEFLKKSGEILKFPLIIKEAFGSFGKQVYLAENLKMAEEIVDSLGHKDFLMQEFIKTSKGRDVRINVVGDKVVCSMLRFSDSDFRSNVSNGGKAVAYKISKEQEEIALKCTKKLKLDFAGVDVLFGENEKPIICEVNSNPHFKSSYEATGVDMAEEIIKYILEKVK